jgi:hypothetical protein
MKAATIGTRRQAILFGILALLLVFFVVRWRGKERPAAAPAPAAASPSEGTDSSAPRSRNPRARTPAPEEIPLLSERDLDPRPRIGGADTGRNLFDFREPTPTPPPVPTPAPTIPPLFGPPGPPSPTATPTPPEPPFRLIGIFGPKEHPIAALHHGNDLINVREGEVVLEQWIIRKIGYESIDVGFVHFAPTETRRLPISQ